MVRTYTRIELACGHACIAVDTKNGLCFDCHVDHLREKGLAERVDRLEALRYARADHMLRSWDRLVSDLLVSYGAKPSATRKEPDGSA